MSESKEVAARQELTPAAQDFNLSQRKAKALAMSGLMPKEYSGDNEQAMAKCLIAVEMANRMKMNPMSVAQNLHIIQGKPTWSSSFVIAAINHCGRFGPLRFRMEGEGDTLACTAWAKDKSDGEVLEGPTVTMAMAKAEGWSTKSGSKWKTMPELMIRYRAAAFFGRLYAPELLAGLHHADEVEDIAARRDVTPPGDVQNRLDTLVEEPEPAPDPEAVEGEIVPEDAEPFELEPEG